MLDVICVIECLALLCLVIVHKRQVEKELQSFDARLLDYKASYHKMANEMRNHFNKQLTELGRTCGQEDRDLHNLAIGASENIEKLKTQIASLLDASAQNADNLSEIKTKSDSSVSYLDIRLSRQEKALNSLVDTLSKKTKKDSLKKHSKYSTMK